MRLKISESIDKRFSSGVPENAWRFTDYFKEQIENKKDFFNIIFINKSFSSLDKKNHNSLPDFKVGDIVTIVSEKGFRHIVFVSEIDENNIPTKAYQTNFLGTGETSFFNTEIYGTDFGGKVRHNGIFLSENSLLSTIIRPNRKAFEIIFN